MTIVSEKQLDEAADLQRALSNDEWLRRCDELFEIQKAVFLEVLTLARDDPTSEHGKLFLDHLSSLQFIGDALTQGGFQPFELVDLSAAVKEAVMMLNVQNKLLPSEESNAAEIVKRQPFIWARLFIFLQSPEVQSSEIMEDITITLWAVTKLYADRFTEILDVRDQAKLN